LRASAIEGLIGASAASTGLGAFENAHIRIEQPTISRSTASTSRPARSASRW
jgi:hypothetical protein